VTCCTSGSWQYSRHSSSQSHACRLATHADSCCRADVPGVGCGATYPRAHVWLLLLNADSSAAAGKSAALTTSRHVRNTVRSTRLVCCLCLLQGCMNNLRGFKVRGSSHSQHITLCTSRILAAVCTSASRLPWALQSDLLRGCNPTSPVGSWPKCSCQQRVVDNLWLSSAEDCQP
jgi:hypothetical protein